ncbi:MAG TPA: ACT domain-containing protein [Polyangia bacterium]|jgi:glycine cleavage system transcriptional repressor
MPQHFALTAVGPDQAGILAALTEPLVRLRCNLEDSSATILRGHFMLMMVVRAPDEVDAPALVREVQGKCRELKVDIKIDARPLPVLGPAPQASHVLSVYGADKPGIVHRVAQILGARGVNMLDIKSQVVGRPGRPVYAMLLEVLLPEALPEAELRRDLDEMAQQLSVDVSLRPIEER